MPPTVALALWLIFLVALFWSDPAKDRESSLALWPPLAWMFFKGSRLPSQWLGQTGTSAAQAYMEGNLLDRVIFSALILMAIAILVSRSFQWSKFFTRNLALMAFLAFALMSVAWSDFSFVSLKRWFRDLGNYLMILVVLSDPRPLEAVRTFLRRSFYLLIPLSILLVKYYPELGRSYDWWTGTAFIQGVATSKNMLGVVCLVGGLFFFWDTLTCWGDRKARRTKRIIQVNAAFMAMTLWLLNLADSATSSLCLAIGCGVLAAAHSKLFRRHPARLKVLIPVSIVLFLILEMGFNISNVIVRAVGRDPTLTTRTDIWSVLLGMKTNPIVGTGYEAFWLGDRLRRMWRETGLALNQAHNGYLELYLNLGIVGLFLLGLLLIASYRNICRGLTAAPKHASLYLALWTVMLFYNVTEAAFKSHFLWVTFLLAAISVPEAREGHLRIPVADLIPESNAAALGKGGPSDRLAAASKGR